MGSIKIVFKPIEEGSAALTDDRRWQGKYFDAEHGKSYFGSRELLKVHSFPEDGFICRFQA